MNPELGTLYFPMKTYCHRRKGMRVGGNSKEKPAGELWRVLFTCTLISSVPAGN